MNKIDTLIAYLFAIQAFAKDIHYSASGEAFYSKHLLADEIYKGIDEQIDALIETCILPWGKPKRILEYYKLSDEYSPSLTGNVGNIDFSDLHKLIGYVLTYIDKNLNNSIDCGSQSLIDSIAQDLQRKLGLITRQVG